MRMSRFAEAQIMGILRQVEGGLALAEVCREHGISGAATDTWVENGQRQKLFPRIDVSEMRFDQHQSSPHLLHRLFHNRMCDRVRV